MTQQRLTCNSLILAAALFLFSLVVRTAAAQEKIELTLLSTTDIHGHIEPWDYYSNTPAELGLAKIETLVRRARADKSHVLLLDCGDTIEGTPLAYYSARKDTKAPNPTIAVMNAMRYAAMAVGNHDFNFGLNVLWKTKSEAHFPWLAANLKQTYQGGAPYFQPYIIRTIAGVRLGIVGFVTPGVPRWELPENYRGYDFEPIVDAGKRVIPELRKQVDLLVVIAHSGLDRDPETGKPLPDQLEGENAMWELAEQVPGIDLIFFGHTHRQLASKLIGSTLLAQAKNWGQALAEADVMMERDSNTGPWRVASRRTQLIPVTKEVAADAEVLKIAEPYHGATQKYLDTPIASSAKALDGSTGRYDDTPLVDLIHKAQMSYAHADVSMATVFFSGARVPEGTVTIRQMAALYIYENTLYAVEMTGAQLKEALEHAASFFPAWPAKPEELRLPEYSADSAEGVSYQIDLTQPVGTRIRNLTYKGQPLGPATKLRVAINSYRYSGGGGYAVYKGLPILYRSREEIFELLVEYAMHAGKIPTEADDNWQVVPEQAREALLERAREEQVRPRPAAVAAPR